MIGYREQNSDIHIFLENDEVARLRQGKIEGTCINPNQPQIYGRLEAVIDDETCTQKTERILVDIEIEDGAISSMKVAMRKEVYEKVLQRGSFGAHEGFRHVNLMDVNRLDFGERMLYERLKTYMNLYPVKNPVNVPS